jgi:hypothetical protein
VEEERIVVSALSECLEVLAGLEMQVKRGW